MKVKDNSETPLPDLSQNDEDFLNDISSKSINELIEDNPKVLLFPPRLGKEDDIGGEHICKFDGEKISTNNIMGFVGKNDSQLTISSRFYHEKDDFFLHYMLQKTMALNIFDFDISKGKDNIYQFYIYLFPYYLKTALAQGLYKKYKKEQYNNSNVKGKIDIARNINKNIPFVGKVAYTIREHSYDNYIMQLIRHTIEHIKTTQSGECVLSADYATRQCVHQIVSATGTYRKSHKQLIINKNIQPFHHPYFTAYRDLQKICMLILRHNGLSFASEKDKVYGVLFDGA